MPTEKLLFFLIVAFIVIDFVWDRLLHYLNDKQWSDDLPAFLKPFYDEAKYRKSQQYDRANGRVSNMAKIVSFALMLGILFFDGFAWLDETLRHFFANPILQALFFFGVLGVAADLAGMPFGIYSIFVIEEKFGFNRTTVKTFIWDKIKAYTIGIFVGGIAMSLLVWFYQLTQAYFWLYAWGLAVGFLLFITLFFSSVLLPMFNKLTPLEEGPLRDAIEAYAQKVDFPLKKIMVMDGSKRSSKANAFFSGFGSQKSIVLFDTLIKDHTTEEVVAVLAHEVGHYKKKHVFKNMIIGILQTGAVMYVLGLLLGSPVLSKALGASQPSFHISLLAFTLLYSPISSILEVIMNVYSRKHEFEADRYAVMTYDGTALQEGLKKMSVNTLTNLNPHPWYVFMHYSHPPLLARLEAMQRAMDEKAKRS